MSEEKNWQFELKNRTMHIDYVTAYDCPYGLDESSVTLSPLQLYYE
jgi:hypothetical protein